MKARPPDPPTPERAGLSVESQLHQKQTITWADDRFEPKNTGSASRSQFHPASVEEAAGIIELQLPEYPLFEDWRTLFASDRQVAYLAGSGVDASLAFRGHANLLIYALRKRRSEGMPRFRDVITLHRQGVNHPEKLTWNEAAELIAKIEHGEER